MFQFTKQTVGSLQSFRLAGASVLRLAHTKKTYRKADPNKESVLRRQVSNISEISNISFFKKPYSCLLGCFSGLFTD